MVLCWHWNTETSSDFSSYLLLLNLFRTYKDLILTLELSPPWHPSLAWLRWDCSGVLHENFSPAIGTNLTDFLEFAAVYAVKSWGAGSEPPSFSTVWRSTSIPGSSKQFSVLRSNSPEQPWTTDIDSAANAKNPTFNAFKNSVSHSLVRLCWCVVLRQWGPVPLKRMCYNGRPLCDSQLKTCCLNRQSQGSF